MGIGVLGGRRPITDYDKGRRGGFIAVKVGVTKRKDIGEHE